MAGAREPPINPNPTRASLMPPSIAGSTRHDGQRRIDRLCSSKAGQPSRVTRAGSGGGVVSGDAKPIRVLFVEDHQLLADALSAMLARESDIEVVGIAGTVAEAKLMSRERLDVVLMDYRLPDGTGAEATRAIKARWPAARVAMVTALTDDETVLESIQAAAAGSLTKTRPAKDVVQAARARPPGGRLCPPP